MKWKHASPPALAVALKALGQQLSSNISLFESAKWLLAEPLCQNSQHNHSEGGTLDKFIVTAVCVCACVCGTCNARFIFITPNGFGCFLTSTSLRECKHCGQITSVGNYRCKSGALKCQMESLSAFLLLRCECIICCVCVCVFAEACCLVCSLCNIFLLYLWIGRTATAQVVSNSTSSPKSAARCGLAMNPNPGLSVQYILAVVVCGCGCGCGCIAFPLHNSFHVSRRSFSVVT